MDVYTNFQHTFMFKQLVKWILHPMTFNWRFWPQYESIIHNNTFSSEKDLTLFSSHIKIHHNICLELFGTVFTCVLDLFIFPPDSYKKTSYCSRKQCFERFESLMIDLFLTNTQLSLHQTLNDGLKWCGLLWCFDEETNSSTSWRACGIVYTAKSDTLT